MEYTKEKVLMLLMKAVSKLQNDPDNTLSDEDLAARVKLLTDSENLEVLKKLLPLMDSGDEDAQDAVAESMKKKFTK